MITFPFVHPSCLATVIGSTFFGFQQVIGQLKTAKCLFIISLKFPSDRIPYHALYLNFGTLAGLWPWAIGPGLKIKVLAFFHHHHEISDP
jgi:hypothetical protein